jgi:Nickel responsive protein SCO4226-like
MPETPASEYVAECFWPGVQDADLQALDERVAAVTAELSRAGEEVRYLGSMLMRADEVVLCLFAGSEAAVRAAAEQASVPFERILAAARSPWPKAVSP